jgi:ribosomal protein L11 methyltransferase
MANWQISLAVTCDVEEAGHVVVDLLDAALDPVASSLHRDGGGEGCWQISVLTETEPDGGRVDAALLEAIRISGVRISDLVVMPLEKKDWLAENRNAFPPLAIGSFWIYGTHIDEQPPEGKIGLCLDAGQAFGSGSHATTAGCINMIERHLSREGQLMIADIGCGSGILAMAAAKWNPEAGIIAVDNDIKATETCADNARRNDVSAAIACGLSEGCAASLVQGHAPYHMIMANILPAPLIAMAADAAALLADDGLLILSGLLDHQQEQVLTAYQREGLLLFDKVIISGWATLVLHHQAKEQG